MYFGCGRNIKKEMNFMKKKLVMLLVLVMAFSFAACGGSGDGDKKQKEDENHKIASVDNRIDYKISVKYPKELKEGTEDYFGSISMDFRSKRLVGDDYELGFGMGKLFSSYSDMDAFLKVYSNGSVNDKIKVDGKDAIVNQAYKSDLNVIIPYDKRKYAVVGFTLKSVKDESDFRKVEEAYKKFYKKKEVKEIIESITLEEMEAKEEKVTKDDFSVKSAGKWFVSDKDPVKLENKDLGDITGYVFMSEYNLNADKYLKTMNRDKAKVTKVTIGDIKYKMFKNSKYKTIYLMAPVKGKEKDHVFHVNIIGTTLDKAKEVLETVKFE